MMLVSRRFGLASAIAATSLSAVSLFAPVALAQDAELVTKEGVIAGTMDIEFNTRTKLDTSGDLRPNSAALGAKDLYKFTLRVADTTEFSGQITRQPNLFSKIIRSKKQDAQLGFKIDMSVLNPKDLKQKKTVGNWVGEVPIDTATGAFDLAGGSAKESPLRIFVDAVGKQASFTENFAGRLLGKAETKDNLAQYTYKRLVGKKEVQIVVKKSDPMRFENIRLAKGPAEIYPTTIVNGRLDYDYETGNWFTDGIRFSYTLNGKEFQDVVTGSIKWVEDPNRSTNGKGYYEFNLRFNEDKNKTANSEGAAFDALSDEDAFFAVDNSIPCLTGRVSYVDTMMSGGELPASSKVEFKLDANKLNKQQIMNFFKLWMICVGPTNDE